MMNDILHTQASAELLYSEAQVEAALDAMAVTINQQLANTNPLVLCVLNGGIITAGKLLTRLTMPLTIDSINASRYQNQTSGGTIEWLLKPKQALQNRLVLIIDDVLDEGITLAAIKAYCYEQGASKVVSAVLIEKLLAHDKPSHADFIGLTVPNRYIFGYGMDYKGYLRNAPGIFACNE
ncbi:MAG: hypoxanthine-guanine phosphoribosyltransferase [Methylovulum sp.]|jgi:hypoxanthine phosphoribosyltransferase|nr:hypoxanthine-guanine phosphoribosyltransferase [Methylovulum sp.]